MAISCPSSSRCDAVYQAWLSGAHPSVAEGIVYRQVCILKWGDCCFSPFNIQVKNCGSYYIYKLIAPPAGCDIRYCGTD